MKEPQTNNIKNEEFDRITPGNLLQFYILGYLIKKREPIYKQEVIDELRKLTASTIKWNLSNGTLFPLFQKTIDNGYVKWRYDDKRSSRNTKRYYDITETGRQYYKDNAYKYKDLLNTTSKFYSTLVDYLP